MTIPSTALERTVFARCFALLARRWPLTRLGADDVSAYGGLGMGNCLSQLEAMIQSATFAWHALAIVWTGKVGRLRGRRRQRVERNGVSVCAVDRY